MLKPRLVLSACLNLERTRYDGKLVENPVAIKLRNFCDVISVCPEISIGLLVPREKIILYKDSKKIKAVEIFTGKDFTEKLISFSKEIIRSFPEIEGFFLKSKSPSCGVSHKTKTYKDIEGKYLYEKSQGIFAKQILKAFPLLPVVDEEIIKNKDELENFLIRIFALRRLRELKEKAKDKRDIISFHKKAYHLLMSYDPLSLREVERFLFSKDITFKESLKKYEDYFKRTLARPFSRGKQINVILHILENFSKHLGEKEKARIFDFIESYKRKKIVLGRIIRELKSLLQEKEQTFSEFYLELYPGELDGLF
ncbi:MAG: DUF1722 domain-containing protein [Thermodesulfobacterium sp.]|nr:DUF1722 domain-containing protein [Thermodesulfobacterium sp.]